MSHCSHLKVRCLNQYDTFRKYLCEDCGGIYICSCEQELALRFLPHQVDFAQEYETQRKFAVSGLAEKICMECRGETPIPYPLAAIWGQKGKIERFYWREIFKTKCNLINSWLKEHNESIEDITDFHRKYPKELKVFKQQAKTHWQRIHRVNPKYDLYEQTESEFLSSVKVPTSIISAKYIQIDKGEKKIGKWLTDNGKEMSSEDFAYEFYNKQGYNVLHCERALISSWVGTFLVETIQDSSDPYQQMCMRHSTRGWRPDNRNTSLISFLLPQDFGSKTYYKRRKESIDSDLERMAKSNNLVKLFGSLLDRSLSLRDYLWVNNDEKINIALKALTFLPSSIVIKSVKWAIQDFWQRQPGWPDLLIYRNSEFKFIEVKSPHDELSQEQMNWFQWAILDAMIPCEILRLKRILPA